MDLATDFADGYDARYLLSFGPFEIQPGDSIPITLAYVAGDNFHQHPSNFSQYFDAFNPDVFYEKLNFNDMGTNARWASWVFDNPGYDTDGDLDSGRYNWACVTEDSIAYYPEDEEPSPSRVTVM